MQAPFAALELVPGADEAGNLVREVAESAPGLERGLPRRSLNRGEVREDARGPDREVDARVGTPDRGRVRGDVQRPQVREGGVVRAAASVQGFLGQDAETVSWRMEFAARARSDKPKKGGGGGEGETKEEVTDGFSSSSSMMTVRCTGGRSSPCTPAL